MNIVIIDDEKPACENLARELVLIDENIQIVSVCSNIKESCKWFKNNMQPDLIFMDIYLPDGLCFEIFNQCEITCPVIFITADEKNITHAFGYNSIDYLLKPILQDQLRLSISKYQNLQTHFVNNYTAIMDYLNNRNLKKTIIVVKRGIVFEPIRLEDVAYFFTEDKTVFVVDKNNYRYVAEKNNLSELEEELDDNLFYRANRKYIINANYVKSFKPFFKKMRVELTLPTTEEIIVSQYNIESFKKWINQF